MRPFPSTQPHLSYAAPSILADYARSILAATTMVMDNPVILLAHGAWHPPILYDPLKNALEARGYEVLVPELVTMGPGKTSMSWDADVAMLLDTATPFFDQGRSVVLVGHSYGGIPACIATRGNGVEDRRAVGKRGGFSHLIFLCGFAMPARGMSVLTVSGGSWLPWHEVIELEAGRKQLFVNEKAKNLLYNDFPPDKAQATFDSLVPCSYEAFTTGVDFAVPEVAITKTFIVCEGDALFPPEHQKELAAACGQDLKQVSVSGGHSAFASIPEELADVLPQQYLTYNGSNTGRPPPACCTPALIHGPAVHDLCEGMCFEPFGTPAAPLRSQANRLLRAHVKSFGVYSMAMTVSFYSLSNRTAIANLTFRDGGLELSKFSSPGGAGASSQSSRLAAGLYLAGVIFNALRFAFASRDLALIGVVMDEGKVDADKGKDNCTAMAGWLGMDVFRAQEYFLDHHGDEEAKKPEADAGLPAPRKTVAICP
ncbi:hypothetical protein DL767_008847 [Monosporascus sp. MG133]|nr:hypothetical protein DL767_008847 [Monosporascus sp. MG133]